MRAARLTLVALLLTGCSLGSHVTLPSVPPVAAPAVNQASGNLCYALSDAEVQAAMQKAPLVGGSGIDMGGLRTCTWTVSFSPVEYASLSLSQASDFTTDRFGGEETIPAIGSGAYWSPTLNELIVSIPKGTLTVGIASSTATPRTAAIQLGKLAAPRV